MSYKKFAVVKEILTKLNINLDSQRALIIANNLKKINL